jgi:small-conductance mechanosensitive channel
MLNPIGSLIRSALCALALLGACLTAPAADQSTGNSAKSPPAASNSAKSPPAATTPGTSGAQRATGTSALPITSQQVLSHVTRTVDWYRGLGSVEQLAGTPQDLLTRDRLHDEAVTAVRLAFEFGRACALILGASASPAAGDTSGNAAPAAGGFAGQLDQIDDRVTQRIAALQTQLDTLDAQLAKAPRAQKAALRAQRGDVEAALGLLRQVQSSLQDMQRFESYTLQADSGTDRGLSAQITELERSVPEASAGSTTPGTTATTKSNNTGGTSGGTSSKTAGASPSAAATANAAQFHPESAGIIALAAEWFSLHGTRRQLSAAIKQTGALINEINTQRRAITDAVRQVLRDAFGADTNGDITQLNGQKAVLEAGTAQFKKLSTALVPIGEQALTMESAQGTLKEWDDQVATRSENVSRYLALRIGFLLASVTVVLVISEVWRRATFRYLHDSRRRRQFLVLRRVAVGAALTVVIIFGLVSELGSVATYAGLITAGVAVALQNVILAIVAYFFLIGRYGVRVGDRITLAGVTGRVVDIGLVRIYLMELAGAELHSTGRIVVLSNAVLFQPTAMFKQIPGADYTWHTITLTLAASADVVEANKRLKAAADEVYAKYHHIIERQFAAVQQLLEFDASTPGPEVRVRWAESGLECVVRYPVVPEDSAAVDQQMLKALRDALAKDPPMKLLTTDAVALKASDASA